MKNKVIFYRPLIGKIKQVHIVTKTKYMDLSACSPTFYYKYLVQFESGLLKQVTDKRLIFTDIDIEED